VVSTVVLFSTIHFVARDQSTQLLVPFLWLLALALADGLCFAMFVSCRLCLRLFDSDVSVVATLATLALCCDEVNGMSRWLT
jgi:hypothetical protein